MISTAILPIPIGSPAFIRLVIDWIVLAWLAVCTVFDLRSRQVPSLLTLIPLGLAGVYRFVLGGWTIVLLAAGLILVSDLKQTWLRRSLSGLIGIIALYFAGNVSLTAAGVGILVAWLLWDLGKLGGADAKLLMAMALGFGDGLVFIWIALAGGIQGLASVMSKHRTMPFTLSIAVGTAVWLWFFQSM